MEVLNQRLMLIVEDSDPRQLVTSTPWHVAKVRFMPCSYP